MNSLYHGQVGQDYFLDKKIFKGMEGGTFVDVGAYDGVEFSNTLFFEKHRKWKGICIEPNPAHFSKLSERNCIIEKVAISHKEGEFEFYANKGYTCGLSGLKDFYPEQHYKRLLKETEEYQCSTDVIKVQCVPLQKILDKHNIDYVHYLSIDVEGGEKSVLKSINFDKTFVDVISFEVNYPEAGEKIISYLEGKNFYLINLELDAFMANRDSEFF